MVISVTKLNLGLSPFSRSEAMTLFVTPLCLLDRQFLMSLSNTFLVVQFISVR